jgi:DNA (cytosine-5)-methyltransferase 1
MSRPLLLDLFCGAGGAAMGYHRAGFDVIGVDISPQPHYPFGFVQADALEYLAWADLNVFDAIHASPPCQAYSAYRRRGSGVGGSHPKLISAVRKALVKIGLPYAIENVPGAPLLESVQLCGSSFGLDVRRHRLFETWFPASRQAVPWEPAEPMMCNHGWQTPRFPPASNRTRLRSTVEVGVRRIPLAVQQKAMGIDWMTLPELSQAIPPAYTEYLGKQLLQAAGDEVKSSTEEEAWLAHWR